MMTVKQIKQWLKNNSGKNILGVVNFGPFIDYAMYSERELYFILDAEKDDTFINAHVNEYGNIIIG